MTQVTFTTRDNKVGTVEVEGPGTNFGARLSASEARRLLVEYGGDNLPFAIMAAGYGEDEDWVGLSTEDAVGTIDGADFEANDWAPFEVSVEGDWSEWTSEEGHALLVAMTAPQRIRTGYDILVEHLGKVCADELVSELRANDLDFTYLTCSSCGLDVDDGHGWSNDITHKFI